MKKVRIEWLDVLKGILIIFVILSHSYPPQIYRNFFTPFFLTMFFVASGYTFSLKRSWRDFFKNKCVQLLIPLLVLGSIRIFLSQLLEGGNWFLRIKGLLLQINCEYDEMWFVACLFSSSILFYWLLKLSQKAKQKYQDIVLLGCSGIGLMIGMLDMCLWKIRIPWQMELAFMMCFYMSLGYLYKRHEKRVADKTERLSYLCIMSLVYVLIVFLIPNNVDIHMENFESPFLFWVLSVWAMLPIIGIAKRLTKNKYVKKIFIFWGQNTLFYYAFGGSVRIVLYKLFHLSGSLGVYLLPIICAVLTMVVLMVPAWVVRSFFPWMIGAKRGSRIDKS